MDRKLIDIAIGELPTLITLKAADQMLNKKLSNENKDYEEYF